MADLIKLGERKPNIFTPARPIEKHFHDHDETWVVMEGRATAYMIDREGNRREFEIEAGDIWMIEVGWEHGADPITPEFKLISFPGTRPEGAQPLGHYYVEKEGYIPHFELRKVATDRYRNAPKGRR